MKIGYVSLKKVNKEIIKKYGIKGLIKYIIYRIKSLTNSVKQDKNNKSLFYINNTNQKTKTKLNNLLAKNKIEYAVYENGIDTGYSKIKSKSIMKYMLPEIIEYCKKKLESSSDEIYLCINEYNQENEEIIEELANKTKVVNIVSNNPLYKKLETKLEQREIYITVINNKRKSLKRAELVINFDFKNFKEFNINRDMVLIELADRNTITKGFEGILVTGIKIQTKRVKRIFDEFENFNKQELLMAEMIENQNYVKNRKFIRDNKIELSKLINKKEISDNEFNRVNILQSHV